MNRTNNNVSNEKITSVIDFVKWVGTLTGIVILYRGQPCSNWNITTAASRFLKRGYNITNDKNNNTISEDTEIILREISHNVEQINHYQVQDLLKKQNSGIAKTDLGILAQLQHDGSATSLIDFTANPLVALWFACQKWPVGEEVELKYEGKRGVVFAIYMDEPSDFEEIDSVDKLDRNIEDIISGSKSIYWKPAHINNRIIAQGSFFVIGGKVKADSKFFIPENDKESILEDLHQRYNIKEISLFPDSSGFAKANSAASAYSKTIFDLWEEGRKLYNKELYKAAIEVYQKIIDNNDYSREQRGIAHRYKGYALFMLDELEHAIDNYNIALNYNREDCKAYINLGMAKRQQKDYDTAITLYNQVIDNLNYKSWQGYINRGLAKHDKGTKEDSIEQYDEAIKDYDAAIDINPYSTESYTNRGSAQLYKKQYDAAIKDYNKAIEYNSRDARIYNNLGRAEFLLKKIYESIKNFDRAIEINPKLYIAYRNRGDSFAALKMYDRAIKDYEHVLLNNVDDWDGRYRIAAIKFELAVINKDKIDMGEYGKSLMLLKQAKIMIKNVDSARPEPVNKQAIKSLIVYIEKFSKELSNKKY